MWRFYETPSGRQVVREALDALDRDARATVVEAIKRRRWGEQFHHEEEHVRGRVHAIRVSHDGRTYRVFYASVGPHDEVLLGLDVVEKKTQKIPLRTLKQAESRLRDWESRGNSG